MGVDKRMLSIIGTAGIYQTELPVVSCLGSLDVLIDGYTISAINVHAIPMQAVIITAVAMV